MTVDIVIPVYNSETTIGPLVVKLIEQLGESLQRIILVNDGSADKSHDVCAKLAKEHPAQLCYLQLARNFGEHGAVMAGLNYSQADCAVIMDDDFQNPPETVHTLIEEMQRGEHDVVYSFYEKKKHSLFRNLGSKFNDKVACWLMNKPRNLYLCSYKCMNRFLVQEVIKYQGPYPYIDGLILRSTNKVGTCLVQHSQREQGESGYTLRKLVRLWLNMFINFSILPLRVCTWLGFTLSALGVLFALWVVVEKILNPDLPLGWSSTITAMMLLSGMQLVMLGLIGEYVGSMFMTVNRTPQFIVRRQFVDGEEKD